MAQCDLGGLVRGIELLACELADGLEQPEPVARAVDLDERLVDEGFELVEAASARLCTNGLGVLHRASSHEGGQASEHASFRLVEERMAPVDRGAQRPLALGEVALSGREHVECVVEAFQQCLGGKEAQTRCSQLERQGKPVQARADGCHGQGVRRRQRERRLRAPRPLDEQGDGRIRQKILDRAVLRRRWQRERRERVLLLAGNAQRCPARGHDPQRGAALHERGEVRSGVDDLLQVVEEEERLRVADERHEPVRRSSRIGLLHVERLRERREHGGRIVHLCERDERNGTEELGRERASELRQDGRLADAAGAGDRHDPMPLREVGEGREVVGASDQRRGRLGKACAEAFDALSLALERRRVGDDEAVASYRVDVERATDVL